MLMADASSDQLDGRRWDIAPGRLQDTPAQSGRRHAVHQRDCRAQLLRKWLPFGGDCAGSAQPGWRAVRCRNGRGGVVGSLIEAIPIDRDGDCFVTHPPPDGGFFGAFFPLTWGVGVSKPFSCRSRRVSRDQVRLSSSRTLKLSLPRPPHSSTTVSPSMKLDRPRWLVPVARISPGSNVWIEVTHSMQRGMLCAISSVLKSCFTSPLTHSLIGTLWGSWISSAVTRYGPIGANVSRDFIAKKLCGGMPRAEPSMKFI